MYAVSSEGGCARNSGGVGEQAWVRAESVAVAGDKAHMCDWHTNMVVLTRNGCAAQHGLHRAQASVKAGASVGEVSSDLE